MHPPTYLGLWDLLLLLLKELLPGARLLPLLTSHLLTGGDVRVVQVLLSEDILAIFWVQAKVFQLGCPVVILSLLEQHLRRYFSIYHTLLSNCISIDNCNPLRDTSSRSLKHQWKY